MLTKSLPVTDLSGSLHTSLDVQQSHNVALSALQVLPAP